MSHLPLGGDAKLPNKPIINMPAAVRRAYEKLGGTDPDYLEYMAQQKEKAKAKREEVKNESVICPTCHEHMPKSKYSAHKKKSHPDAPKEHRLSKKNYMN
jgi:uncharacterized short protein YbdD (DUF466 family)